MGFPGGSVGKRPPANTGDTRSIPELGTRPGEGNVNSIILAWGIPRTEEPCGILSMRSQKDLDMT